MLCHRHLPHQLVHGGTRDWEEPAAAAGEQYLDKGRLEPLRAYYYYSVKMVCISAGTHGRPAMESLGTEARGARRGTLCKGKRFIIIFNQIINNLKFKVLWQLI